MALPPGGGGDHHPGGGAFMIKRFIVGASIAAGTWAAYVAARQWWSTWGVDDEVSGRGLPGDELVPDPKASDTRVITVDAPPEAIWPWLVQMGYGRAGWYSFDALDMKGSSSDSLRPELQTLALGDLVPTDPDGGFEVKVLEPERALVLYVDTALVAARPSRRPSLVGEAPGLAVSGKALEAAVPPEFNGSWAFALEPIEDGRTRLIERVRIGFDSPTPGARFAGPLLGFGIFVMTQRQMQGIKARAEKLARDRLALHREVDEVANRASSAFDTSEAAPAAG
jgi:hypothetical protein